MRRLRDGDTAAASRQELDRRCSAPASPSRERRRRPLAPGSALRAGTCWRSYSMGVRTREPTPAPARVDVHHACSCGCPRCRRARALSRIRFLRRFARIFASPPAPGGAGPVAFHSAFARTSPPRAGSRAAGRAAGPPGRTARAPRTGFSFFNAANGISESISPTRGFHIGRLRLSLCGVIKRQ